jgi:hypothetical protein
MKKNLFLVAACCATVLLAACSDDDNSAAKTVPEKAIVAGAGANACPAVAVTLTAQAENALSFVWYNGATKIAGATGASYEVTVSGTYYAAGVNDTGEGAKSDAKTVTISTCGATTTAPEKATVTGGDANTCPAESVLLTAAATGAASYKWYNGTAEITGATAATYSVTASGTYYAAGVNDTGEGAKSDAKAVTISTCATAPEKATITGDNANTCPAESVVLTAAATGATSYKWYNGTAEIAGATAATYSVTASGTYYAAGVNEVGAGAKSDAKAVTISTCGGSNTYVYTDLLGNYNATGVPSILQTPGAAAWASTMTQPSDGYEVYYGLSNFGNTNIKIWIDYTDGVLTLDNYSKLGSGSGYDAYLMAVYIQGGYIYEIEEPYEVHWNVATQTLDMSGTVNGTDVLIGIAAVNPSTGAIGGFFADGYKNLQFTKTATGAPGSVHATVVKTTPIPGSTLRMFEGVKIKSGTTKRNISPRIPKN